MPHLALLLLLSQVLPGSAHADGQVTAVQSADGVGAWSTLQPATGATTGEAFLLRHGGRVALHVGDTLRDTDIVVTRRRRVRRELPDKDVITVYDGTVVAPEEHGLRHVLGGLLVQVQGAFRVQSAQAEATVEGTRLRVEEDAGGQGVVVVEEGACACAASKLRLS